ncbi:MAG: hypothetical protein H6577_22740 [Lewinellaceae bacterium]|nr:hypothetical protein [Lewinellaceae bacterium]
MKKTLPLPIIAIACLALFACGGKNAPATPAQPVEGVSTESGAKLSQVEIGEEMPQDLPQKRDPAVLQQVLDQLYVSGADFRWPKPAIRLVNSQNFVATFRPRSNEILVEEKALEACRSFARDSTAMIAFLIGHELSHFYENEGNKLGTPTNFLAFGQHQDAGLQSEINADLRGIFLCHVAGYNLIRSLLPNFIEQIYASYQLDKKALPNYPPKQERQAHATLVQHRADTLFHIFHAAIYLTGFGKYAEANACYDYLLKYYNGAEVYNNLGVLNALQAMQVGGKNPDSLWYPLELDVYTRLERARDEPLTPVERQQREDFLNNALEQFETAIAMNPAYEAANTNLLCTKLLLGRNEAVIAALENKRVEVKGDVKKLLVAIAKAQTGKDIGAIIQLFKGLEKSENVQVATVARFNATILSGQEMEAAPQTCSLKPIESYPDGVKLGDLRWHGGYALDKEGKYLIHWQQKAHSTLYKFNTSKQLVAFQIIHSPAIVIDPRLKVGLSMQQKDLPARQVLISANLGSFWMAAPCQLMIKTKNKRIVEEWAIVLE